MQCVNVCVCVCSQWRRLEGRSRDRRVSSRREGKGPGFQRTPADPPLSSQGGTGRAGAVKTEVTEGDAAAGRGESKQK